MAIAPAANQTVLPPRPKWDALGFARTPLVPLAIAGTCGIVLDRYTVVPLQFSLAMAAVALIAWAFAIVFRGVAAPLFMCAGVFSGGAAFHHVYLHALNEDDVAHIIRQNPQPIHLRGLVQSQVEIIKERDDPLSAFPQSASTRFVLAVSQYKDRSGWQNASGLVQVIVEGELTGIRTSDELELVGRISVPEPPENPGQFDYAAYLRDRRIRAVLQIYNTTAAVTRLHRPTPVLSLSETLASVRTWANGILRENLPAQQHGVAAALLLGDESAMTDEEWEAYMRTGVVHVLAISGQHLAVLGGFVWFALRLFGVRRRTGAVWVMLFVFAYAALVGGRPPVLRAAGMVAALCGALLWQRPFLAANAFAAAWIAVAACNPTNVFNTGCQLSFLAVAVLVWGLAAWTNREREPLAEAIDESRPLWSRWLIGTGRIVVAAYVINAAVWIAVTPLVASRHHVVSPIAVLIGPPMILLTSVALLSGFLLLLGGHLLWPVAFVLSTVMSWSLSLAEAIVYGSAQLPLAYFHVPDVPEWLLWIFYASVFAQLAIPFLQRHWHWCIAGSFAWCVVVAALWTVPWPRPFRCTFVAVGHGACVVIESENQVLVYDAGAISGPEVTRRVIAPFLWNRGIYRIDELVVSHADLDHFNGVPALLQRFAVQRINLTPTFRDRQTKGAQHVLDSMQALQIPHRTLCAGMRTRFGELTIDVLHPPSVGPNGNENSRSMVLLCRLGSRSILLTGDLEQEGLQQLLDSAPIKVDVLMAPHHGSQSANTPTLAAWARPKVAVSCQARTWRENTSKEPYTDVGATYLPTWPHGAVIIEGSGDDLLVETYRSGRLVRIGSE